MNLKSILKLLKLNESTISMILGALVIIVVGMLVVNYFRSSEPGTTIPNGASTEGQITLPTTHVVEEGETLWSIAEKYYQSGYNWVDIAQANNLTSANVIEKGQELTIPDVEARGVEEPEPTIVASPLATVMSTPTATATPMVSPTPEAEIEATEEGETIDTVTADIESPITGDEYTVVRGDNLWNIAVRAYGDGYKWVEIARANDLANPDLIHAGNQFVIPR